MGRVLAAEDERLHRRVAIKLLKDELVQDPRFVERFRREARAVAALSHPNVATVFDYGEDDACHYIVMEHVEGKDLSKVLREDGPLSMDRSVRIATQVCGALAHAHSAGVIHRDIKPANIIVGPSDRVKVTDFGIARAAGDSTLTATGSVLGTAQYISPEQASGAAVTPATDVYSLGIVLYEMLTGAVPFTGDTPVAIAMKQVHEPLPKPSALNADVPPSLDDVVARATQKDPNERYPDAPALAAALATATATTVESMGSAPTVVDHTATVVDDEPTVWPIPGSRWDPQRVGRAVWMTLGALALVALLVLALRLAGGEDDAPRRSGATGSDPSTIVLSNDLVGFDAARVAVDLRALGLRVEMVPTEAEAEPGTVVDTDPDQHTEVEEGSTVTLFVAAEGDDDEGKGKGEPKGKAKGKDEDDDD